MIKRSFIGLVQPRLEYTAIEESPPEPKKIPTRDKVTILLESSPDTEDAGIKKGDSLRTGQLVRSGEKALAVATATGTVGSVMEWPGDFGSRFTAISVRMADEEELDEQFGQVAKNLTLQNAVEFLSGVPGKPALAQFADPDKEIHTIVITGVDRDVYVQTNQYVVQTQTDALEKGIELLKKITGVGSVVLVTAPGLLAKASSLGADVKGISNVYPSAVPRSIMKDVMGQVVPAGKEPEDIGFCFMSAEAVASLGKAVQTGKIPVEKLLTLIDKEENAKLVKARIGTPMIDVLDACGITINEKDRVVFGGPMTGSAVFSEDHPVGADTDAIMVQSHENIALVSDYPCVNCGECVRICPAKMPVSMLVRFLEVGQYEEGAEKYDLYSCFECGLCSFVCVSRIPIFQYIRLAKYELDRVRSVEATNV